MVESELVFSNEASPGQSPVTPQELNAAHTGLRVFEHTAKGNLDKIAGFLGIDAGVTHLGLVQEASRSKTVVQDGAQERWGVAVRLVVSTDKWDVKAAISVPVVAASVELGLANASASIDVSGYTGDISNLLPQVGALDVTAYSTYISAYGAIQAKVLGDEENQAPALLERTPPSA